ncbi:calcium-binding protein [Micromonospora chalcea]|uniref:calcium-binding protein n=1 Tax=Micromonospora chalcea TaxID=1874 RepID=UPI00068B3E14|nr:MULTISPECIES: calcium-binding protein [Micromonospora]MCT2282178.1 calcium-binding protein [Micromonospora chalcea]
MSHHHLFTPRAVASVIGALVLAAAGLAGGAAPASAAYIVPGDCGPYSGAPVPAGYATKFVPPGGLYVSNNTSGPEFIIGTTGSDVIVGSVDDDVICGFEGSDNIQANSGDDIVYGGLHGDDIWGDLGNDNLHGDGGTDTIHGDRFIGPSALDGNDRLDGGSNTDELYGDDGDDTLVGGPGPDDYGEGNAGSDICRVSTEDCTV